MSIRTRRVLAFLGDLPKGFQSVLLSSVCLFSVVWMCWPVGTQAQDASPTPEQAATTLAVPVLEVGKPIEGDLVAGQRHSYQIKLDAGQSVKIEVEQLGIDVVLQLFSSDNINTPEVDAEPWAHGKEVILWEAAVTDAHRVEVRARRWPTPAGRYVIRWTKVDESAQGERRLAKASRLCAQAINQMQNGKYNEGIKLAEESLALRESLLPPNDPAIAESLYWLISLLEEGGDVNDQERIDQLYARRLQILERAFGPDHPHVARWLNDLANRTELVRAVELFQRGLTILENSYGPDHPDIGLLLSNYAIKLDTKGDYERAEEMYKRAADIREKTVGQDDILAQSLNNLGDFYLDRDDYDRAELCLQRALSIWTNVYGRQHYRTAIAIGNLGDLYRRKGDFARAELLAKETLEIFQKVSTPNSTTTGGAHYALGLLYLEMGDYLRAKQSLQKSKVILEPYSNQVNNGFVGLLRTSTRLALAMGKNDEAVAYQRRATEISESELNKVVAFGSEQDKLNFLKVFADETNEALSLHARYVPNDAQALQLAFTTWLQRKGRALDEMNRSIGLLRRFAGNEAAPLFTQLMTKQSQRSRLAMTEPNEQNTENHNAQVQQLAKEIDDLQSAISARSAEFRAQVLPPVTLDDVRMALPPGSALIEFAQYQPEDAQTKKKLPSRYLAYVLPKEGALRWVELGDAAKIDAAVKLLRQTIGDKKKRADPRPVARKLDELVMQPIRSLLGQARMIFLSPDGELNLAPFAALLDERGRYLIEDYLFIYLVSGRDLLRLQIKQESKSAAFVLADPAFDGQSATDSLAQRDIKPVYGGPQTGLLSIDFANARFNPLPGTAGEAQALKRILPNATVLTREQASEAALKQVSRPRLLHIATHGFFLPDLNLNAGDARNGEAASSKRLENPLLRCGLALAGANLHKSGNDDGILTALEAAGLDLWGTKLVVLSACDTGVGEVKNGEGVYGLRRAFVLAGSESQVMSLWSVSDTGTKELMVEYYKRLMKGEGRGKALRQVQLQMLKTPNRRHPFYWASFIQSGEWANLDGKR